MDGGDLGVCDSDEFGWATGTGSDTTALAWQPLHFFHSGTACLSIADTSQI